MTKVHFANCEITVFVGNDDTIDSMWQKLQDLLRDKGMANSYVEKSRSSSRITIDLVDFYSQTDPLPEPCKEVCHFLSKIGYRKGQGLCGGYRFDP